jgi:hypothetical protein
MDWSTIRRSVLALLPGGRVEADRRGHREVQRLGVPVDRDPDDLVGECPLVGR